MSLDSIIEKVKNGKVTLLGEVMVNDIEYEHLINYTKIKIHALHIQTNATFDILLSVALVQIAIREYKEGNYWDCFSEIFPDISLNNRNYIGQVFYQTLKVYKLFIIEGEQSSRMQYVENIKAHAFVPNNYLSDYFDFLFSFYNKNLLRTVPPDLNEDIEEFQEYLTETLNDSGDKIKVDSFGNNTSKSYKLLKATRIAMSRLDTTYVSNFLKPHLEYIDNYYFDDQLPEKQGRFEIGVNEWSKSVIAQFADKEKRKRKSGKWYTNRKPYYKLLDNTFKIIIPEQKFRLDEYNGSVYLNINGCEFENIDAYRAFGIIITEEIITDVGDIFAETRISVNSLALKEHIIPHKNYRIFDEDKNEIEKLKSGYCYIAIKDGVKVTFQDCENLNIININNTANIYYVEIKETSIIYINNMPLSLAGEFSVKTQYDFVSNEYLILDENGLTIQTTYKHPVVSFIVEKEHFETALIWCNQERFSINNPYSSVFFEMPNDCSKIGVSINLNNLLVNNDGYYRIFLDEPTKSKHVIGEYLFIANLRCSTDKRRYTFCKEAQITISEDYQVIALNCCKNENGKYILKLNEAVKSADFDIIIDNKTYRMIIPINVLQFGFNGLLFCNRPDYVWYKDISNNFNLILPGVDRVWIFFNKDEANIIEGKLIKGVFNFDISQFVNEMESNKNAWNYLNIKYIDNKERRMPLLRLLKTLWFSSFALLQEENNIIIFTEYYGKTDCFVKIIDIQTNNVIIERRNLVNYGKTYFPELDTKSLYKIERFSVEADDFGFGEDICHLNTIYKIGVIDFSDISNCKVVIDQILYKDQILELNYNYTIRDLVKFKDDIYIGRLTGKLKNINKAVREETIFQRVQIEIIEYAEDKIHFTILLEENLDWLEPLYNCQGKNLSLEDNDKKAKYKYLFEEETEVIATLRRDK